MKITYLIALVAILNTGCQEKASEAKVTEHEAAFNQALAEELARMVEVDQIAANIPQGEYKQLSLEAWKAFQDSVFTTHQVRINEIFERHGFPGYKLVGEDGSKNFWLMVQHSDHDTEFQHSVLKKMKVEVEKGNANASYYGLLTDRVNINTGKAQIYGTQLTYNTNICQAYPKELADSAGVNERRKAIGLPPIEEYLNEMSQMHFEMNKENYVQRGVMGPKLYETE